jgi:putative FmdB family regulatory protein
MPIYEYVCTACGRIEEAIQKFSDRPLSKCSRCSGKLQRLISQSAFHLKGSGWYADGYADKPRKTAKTSPGAKPAATAAGKSGGSSSPDKPKTD